MTRKEENQVICHYGEGELEIQRLEQAERDYGLSLEEIMANGKSEQESLKELGL